MKNDFDNKIKDLLEGSTSADAGFEFDRTAVWERIESKQKTKHIPFKKWISHAAAVVIGILLCLPFLFRSEKETVKTVTVTKTVPVTRIIKDTVLIVQNSEQGVQGQSIHPSDIKKKLSPETLAVKEIQRKEKAIDANNISTVANPEPVIVKTETLRPKVSVLHLADIENENASPQIKHTEGYALFNKINIPARMDDKSETISMIVSNQFFH